MSLTETLVLPSPDDTPEAALDRQRRLLDVCLALNAAPDLDALLHTIAETTTVVLRCEAASILLYDARDEVLRFAAATGDDAGTLRDVTVPLAGSLAGTIFSEDRPLLALDLDADPRHFPDASAATGLRPDVLLGVPMRVDGQPVGVLEALNPLPGAAFDAASADTLLVIAAQAAVALRNARQRDALARANARLQDLDRARVQFLTVASHELRTPLTAVRGYADVLADEVPPALAPFVAEVQAAGRRMQDIVETVETMATLRDETGAMAAAPVSVADLLAEAQQAADRPLAIGCSDPGLAVLADAGRLRLALAHLVRNADTFTPPEGMIALTARAEGADVALAVSDTGRGIAPENLERVFEPFFQVEPPETRSHEGLGVGLAVARAVVLRHGGRLWAESAGPGRGATFHVRLPRAA